MKRDYITPSNETWYRDRNGDFYLPKEIAKEVIDNNNPETFVPLLKMGNYPYVKWQWEKLAKRYPNNVFGRYLSVMKLNHWAHCTFQDSDYLNQVYKKFETANVSGYTQLSLFPTRIIDLSSDPPKLISIFDTGEIYEEVYHAE